MSVPEYIASPETLLGLLQRGRGEGYRRALKISKAESHDLLTLCITRDPRLDSQVETRSEYYASLAIEIELPLEKLAEHLRQNDDPSQGSWATPLTVTTLTELAKRSYRNAEEILCDYIKWGQWWDWPLDDLLNLSRNELTQRIAYAVEQHFPVDDALDEGMRFWPSDYVKLSPFSSRIAASLSKMSKKSTEDVLPDLNLLSPRELLDLTNQKNYRHLGKAFTNIVSAADVDLLVSRISLENPFVSHVALAGLTKIAPASLSAWLADLWLKIPAKSTKDGASNFTRVILRQGVSRAILALPAITTLPIARNWIAQKDSQKRELAEKVLRDHATAEDIPALRQSLLPMLKDEDAEYSCFLVKAFYHLPKVGIIQELIDIFYHFRFSTGRSYAAKAIQITSPDFFKETLALESLWDCEDETRKLGAKFAPLETPEARHRIRYLAEDSFESDEVRIEAKARLK